MDIKEIKKEVRTILRKNGFKKVALDDFHLDSQKVFHICDGSICFHVGKIYYAFGFDKLMGCSAHICDEHSDCCTLAEMLLPTFKKHIAGEITEKEVSSEWFPD